MINRKGIAIILALFAFTACSGDKDSAGPPDVELAAQVEGDEIQIDVRVPRDHHAYLDRGDSGVLVPIDFDWQPALEETGVSESPSPLKTPIGERDDAVGALVLRGLGRFQFEHDAANQLQGKTIRVRTQICDDIQGICYRPAWNEVVL